MITKSLTVSILALCTFLFLQQPILGYSQNNPISPINFNKAIELYQADNYIAAEKIFIDILDETPENDPLRFDLDYYRLMCLVKQNKSISENEISSYLSYINGSPWENQLWFELSKLQFSNRRYKQAATNFKNVNASLLKQKDKEDYAFYIGYSNFESGDLKAASQSFYEVKKSNSIYASSASYYWGYINYLEGNYKTALDEFSRLDKNKQFAGFIKYYTVQIYYLQEKYDKVIEIGEKLVASAPAEQKNELLKIVGDAYYETGNYINAIKYLDAYEGVKGKKTAEDFFRVAYCYYKIKIYDKAILAFEKSTVNKDYMAQNAFYHLADCELKLDNKNKARVAFEQASKFDFDPKIEEDALFNFAKLTYELSYSPFNETIKAFDQYIAKYPDSGRNDAAFDYLVKVYMTTRNYRDAISSIENIKNQSPSIKEAYQRVTYYRGLELLNDGHYSKALEFFEKSIQNSNYNRTYKALALYWNAETFYRIRKYNDAISYFEKFQSTPGAFSLPEFGTAYYNTGYCYFNQNKYEEASSWFRKYLNQSNTDKKLEADASNRIGDGYYINRKYDQAIEYYQRSSNLASYDPDYSMYQIAVCQGLARNYNEKIDQLRLLIDTYPRSSFVDDALFEVAKTNERLGNIDEAIAGYNFLNREMPQSIFDKKAFLQLGLIFYNKSNYNSSIENYKKVIEKYPNSEEAKAALVGIKNNYVDMNNVDGYFSYVNNLDNTIVVTINEQDSLFYMAAEKSYMDGKEIAGTQLEEYLKRFPDGNFENNALFYTAEFYYGKEQYSKSLEFYKELASNPDNIFTEQSLIKAGELTFNAEQFNISLEYFNRLEQIANTKWNTLKARLGLLRCYYLLDQPAQTVKSAVTLLATENITELMIREANYKLAKSYYILGEHNEALKYFKLLANDMSSIEGAESKYFIAQIFYNQNKYEQCEKEIMDFISKNTPHSYWLAKSFLLLSDVYLAGDDIFQAKHTLKSIIDNYNNLDDGIVDTAKQKIKILESKEKESIIIKETIDSTQKL